MKIKHMAILAAAGLALAGCTTREGGTSDRYDYNTGAHVGESNPQPADSPTFRPGMNPQDPRDPHFTNRPQPDQLPYTK
jgi:hypothetical protein